MGEYRHCRRCFIRPCCVHCNGFVQKYLINSLFLAQRQSHIRRSIKAVNYDKVFSFIEPFSFLTVKTNFEMSSVDEQHKSLLAAHYVATQEFQNKSAAGVRLIFDDFYPKCSNLQLNFNNPFILLLQTCA